MSEKKGILSFLKLDNIADHVNGLIQSRLELAKIELKEEVSGAIARALVGLTLFGIGFVCITFLSLAAGYFLGSIFNSHVYGFLIVGSFYLVIFLIILFLHKPLGLLPYFEKTVKKVLNIGE